MFKKHTQGHSGDATPVCSSYLHDTFRKNLKIEKLFFGKFLSIFFEEKNASKLVFLQLFYLA